MITIRHDSDWLMNALIKLGEQYGHVEMRVFGKKALKSRGIKSISDLKINAIMPFYNEVKAQLFSLNSELQRSNRSDN